MKGYIRERSLFQVADRKFRDLSMPEMAVDLSEAVDRSMDTFKAVQKYRYSNERPLECDYRNEIIPNGRYRYETALPLKPL